MLGDFFSKFVVEGFFTVIGHIYLTIRYPKKEKRKKILETEYGNSVRLVGSVRVVQAFAFIVVIVLFISLIMMLVTFIGSAL